MEFIGLRDKMGTEIRTYAVSGGFVYTHAGKVVHVTSDDVRADPVAKEAHFLSAWQAVTGFVPFTVLRRHKGALRRLGLLFVPADTQPVRFRRGWRNVAVRYQPSPWARAA